MFNLWSRLSRPRWMNTDESIPTRKSLLGRLKDWDDNESWRDFFQTYWKLIYNFAIHRGLTHQEAEEVVQETVLAVAKSIPQFSYDPAKCAFKTWLLTVTRSKIANQFARRAPQVEAEGKVPEEDAVEKDWDEEWRRNLMEAAIERVKDRVSIEQFQMFDLFALKGWPARDVARTLGVTVAHVYVNRHRLTKLVRKEAALLEAKGA